MNGNNEGEIEMRDTTWSRLEHSYTVRCKRLKPEAKLPVYAKEGDSGLDVFAPYNFSIGPGEQLLVMTGWAFELPEGMEFQARPKSGLAVKGEITMTNTPGTIDSNYRGEVGFILRNLSSHKTWNVLTGEKIGQLVLCPVFKAVLEEVDELSDTDRGAGGFGSTGR
jgi:dUTP pyrophosphatase